MTSISKLQGRTNVRQRLLAGAATAAIATLAPTAAHAGDISVTKPGPVITVINGKVINPSTQNNAAPDTANANNGEFSITTATQSGTTNSIAGNDIFALARANEVVLEILGPSLGVSGDGDGISSLANQDNSGTILANALGNDIFISIDGFQTGSALLTDNSISATSLINDSTTNIVGPVPAGYSSSTDGTASLVEGAPGAGTYTTEASLSAMTLQNNTGVDSAANTDDNNITLDVDTVGTVGTIGSAATVSGNSIDADFAGNRQATNVELQGTDNPTFAGSVAVLSSQGNTGGAFDGTREARNLDSTIEAEIGSTGAAGAAYAGVLALTGNEVGSSATGNSSDNNVQLDSSLSFVGAGGLPPAGSAVSGAGLAIDADGDLALASSQRNEGAGLINARTDDADVRAIVESTLGGQVNVSGNTLSSSATGNEGSNGVSNVDGGAASSSFSGTATIVGYQSNAGGGSRATAENNDLEVVVGSFDSDDVVEDSSVTIAGNTDEAAATGNRLSQSLNLEAVTLDIGTGSATLGSAAGGGAVAGSSGGATVTSLQLNSVSPVEARNRDSEITLDATTATGTPVRDSSLSVAGNTQSALGIGNIVSNDLSLEGNAVGTGAGINSLQVNDGDSEISARTRASASLSVSVNSVGSSLSLSGNQQLALASANHADNVMSVDSNSTAIDPAAPADVASQVGVVGIITNAGYAVQNGQANESSTDADVRSDDSLLSLTVGNRLRDSSSAAIDGNNVQAAAYGNEATNSLDLDLGNVTVTGGGHANVAAVSNGQLLAGPVSATVNPNDAAIQLIVGEDVEQTSSVSVSGNQIRATAVGNRTSLLDDDGNPLTAPLNTLSVTATNIDTAAAPGDLRGSVDNNFIEADAAFVAQSGQINFGTAVSASTLSDDGAAPDIFVDLDRRITDSSVTVAGNQLSASATSNSAATVLTLSSNGLRTTAVAQNYQETAGDVSATAGGRASGILVTTGQTGGSLGARRIENASIAITGNSRTAEALGNNGGTVLAVTGNNITSAGNNPSASAGTDDVAADFIVSNAQSADGSTITADANGTLTLDSQGDTNIGTSAIAISGNTQGATAIGSNAVNGLSLQGTNLQLDEDRIPVTSALASDQSGDDVSVNANTLMTISSPAEVSNSSVSLSNNVNAALAAINNVTNVLSVSATNIETSSNAASADAGPSDNLDSTADHLINSFQTASGAVNSTAQTAIGNADQGDQGVASSALTISGNSTSAVGVANASRNTATINGIANNGGSVALGNDQRSSATVNAVASTTAGFSLDGATAPAVANSAIVLNGNSTTAVATGNSSVNSLTHSGGMLSPNNAGATAALNGSGDLSATASALVLNSQNNSGAVGATAVSATYSVALNGGAAQSPAVNSTVSIAGNTIGAVATGNSSVNTLTMTGLNMNGASAAVANNQVNSGPITATATGTLTIGATGSPVSGSTLAIGGNSIGATAVGNSAVITITNGN